MESGKRKNIQEIRRMAKSKGIIGKIVGVLSGIGAALTAWYFLDPKNGPARRKRVAKEAKKTYSKAEKEVKKFSGDAKKTLNEAYDKSSQYVKEGKEWVSEHSQTAVDGAKKLGDKAKSRISR
jgi:hypothetical protein